MSAVLELTDETFQKEVVDAGVPVLVDFWAPWCGPCRAVSPTIESLAADYQGRVKIAKINVDEQQAIAGALRIQSIPTVALFDGNKVIDAKIGAMPRHEYTAMLDRALAKRAN